MERLTRIVPLFTEDVPEHNLELGRIYINRTEGYSRHLCPCGCGTTTYLRYRPQYENGWTLTESEEKVSISPRIFEHNCINGSRYTINDNNIEWID